MLFWILIILLSIFVIFLLAVYYLLHFAFARRFDQHPQLKYFTIQDFPEYEMDVVTYRNRSGENLRGGFYYDDQKQPHRGLIIFCHGVGAGHHAYTHLILEFVRQRYVVFAFDYTGCGLSSGKAIKGIPQAILDLEDTLHYLSKTTYRHFKWNLVGHSWGAYTALRASRMAYPVQSIISIAPFNSVTGMLSVYMPWIKIAGWWVTVLQRLRFGRLAHLSTARLLQSTNVPTLVIYGNRDQDVPLSEFHRYEKTGKTNPQVVIHVANDRRHNPYLSVRAENYVIDTILGGTRTMAKEQDETKRQAFFEGLDYRYVGEHDGAMLQRMFDFIEKQKG